MSAGRAGGREGGWRVERQGPGAPGPRRRPSGLLILLFTSDASPNSEEEDFRILPPMEAPQGLREWDMAASGRAICLCCGLPIAIHTLRFRYQTTAKTNRVDHLRYIHPGCVSRLPPASRHHDHRVVRYWLEFDVFDDATLPIMQAALDALAPAAAAG